MLLDLAGVVVRYGAMTALHGVDLTVDEGEVVALLGANGAGKTTTLRTISGLLRPTAGTVSYAGQRIDALSPNKICALGVGHVPEGRRVFRGMSVEENLDMGAYLVRDATAKDKERVFALFPVLAERRTQDAATLSGGEQQMLAIARALMGRPRLLLLDEPSLGLAPIVVRQILDIVSALREQGTTVLLVEQNAALALRLADRGYVLETGSVALTGSADVLLGDTGVRAAYLGE
jgi:branched-chain amino acid transport system ATP-binding protein